MSFILGYLISLPFQATKRLPMRMCVYLASLAFYHWAEYWYVCLFHYNKLHFDSKLKTLILEGFLIN